MKKNSKKRGKKIAGVGIGAVIIAALIGLVGNGFGFSGLGTGSGIGIKDTANQQEADSRETEESTAEADETEELSKVVTVTIKENQVFVGDKEFSTEADLKKYIEEINSDERGFELKEENSILETHEWVIKVFEDLKIQLVPVEE